MRKRKKDRDDGVRRDGLNRGWGADVFFHKTMYNRFRFAKLKFFTKTTITYLIAAVLMSVLLLFASDGKTEGAFMGVALVLGGFVYYRSLGNPLHEDMVEAASMIPHLYCVTLVMNADMKLAEIYAGHYLTSWETACRAVDRIYRVSVPRKADAIIASCGGFPKDMSLYQGTKTIDNIETGLKRGGKLILLIEARDGGGPEEYFDWIQNLMDGSIEKSLRESFTVPGYIFFLNCEQAQRYQIYLLTSIPNETVAPMGIHAYNNMKDLLEAAQIENDLLYVIPNGSTVIPYAEEA